MEGDNILLRDKLLAWFNGIESCAVALSAGVDSGVVAKAAYLALGEKCIAVTGTSDSLAQGELEEAQSLARLIGLRHEVIRTREFEKPEYLRNAPDRCYHCKTELYDQMQAAAPSLGVACLVNGLNADDLGDYRPGIKAAKEHAVRSPLAECAITKAQVRELAAHWGLPIWDKPATPCLSSRVAYGEEVTPERLKRIDEAERYLRSLGLREVRVRYHRGDLARLEVPIEAIEKLAREPLRTELAAKLQSIGFKFVTLDLQGFRSGSLNALVNLELASK
jgi:pyridinium-3,5-biscarboxylic acid mononucleotide sulfurtransferase